MKKYHRSLFFLITGLALLGMGLLFPDKLRAAGQTMKFYASPSGVFQIRMPDGFTAERNSLRITPEKVLTGERIVTTVNQRPFRDQIKHYVVQVEQTLGPALTEEEANYLVEYNLRKYIDFYRANNNAIVKSENKTHYGKFLGGEAYLTYEEEGKATQAIRIKLFFTDLSKVLLIATSADQGTFSLSTQEFFNSIRAVKGASKNPGNFLTEWDEYVSPMRIFSVLLPPKAEPYTPGAPKIDTLKNAELMTVPMFDPVRGDKFIYRVYGYRLDKPLTLTTAKNFLIRKHAGKFINPSDPLSFSSSSEPGDIPIIETSFYLPYYKDKKSRFSPRPHSEGAVRLRATFLGNYIVVQEIESTKFLLASEFATNLLPKIIFHPEDAEKLRKGIVDNTTDATDAGAIDEKSSEKTDISTPAEASESAAKEENSSQTDVAEPQDAPAFEDTPMFQDNAEGTADEPPKEPTAAQ